MAGRRLETGGAGLKRARHLLLLTGLILLVLSGCRGPKPVPSGFQSETVDPSGDPLQEDLTPEQGEAARLTEHLKGIVLEIVPLARYRVAAEVKGVERYSRGWQGRFAPCDLALAWGNLAGPGADRFIRYSQGNRWYHYRYSGDLPFPPGYIASHSANTHVVPATRNLRRALAWTRTGDRLVLEGDLIRVTGRAERGTFYWNSSTSRLDTGDNSCELLYLRRLVRNHLVYR